MTTTQMDPRVAEQLPEMLGRPMARPLTEIGDAISNRSAAAERGYFVQLGRESADEYVVLATWILPACDDEDPGSINCGCPLQGRPHAHAEARYTDREEARRAWAAAKIECHLRLPVSFARSSRVGA